MKLLLLCFATVLGGTVAMQPGDRITASYQTMQGTAKSTWVDLDLTQLPRFQTYGSAMLLPVFAGQFDPTDDAKLFFTFADNKLIIPWTIMYSAKDISNMEKLVVTFVHDEYDVLQINYQPLYGTNLDIISKAQYPVLEVEYLWESVQEDDVTTGVYAMFTIALFVFIFLTYTSCSSVSGRPTSRGSSTSFHPAAHHDGLRKKNVD